VLGRDKMTSKINIDGVNYDLKRIADRSVIMRILKEKIKGCDEDYIEVTGDFKVSK
jgi:hypothetical protein